MTAMDTTRYLIVTTKADYSLPYFLRDEVRVAYFDDDLDTFRSVINREDFGIIYLRDPFNTGNFSLEKIKKMLRLLAERQTQAYLIDHAATLNDLLIEDKWRQYERLKKWMPKTVPGSAPEVTLGETIAKKRISSRSKGIRFGVSPGDLSDEWIVQERLAIQEELRVYCLFGKVVRIAALKRPKTLQTAAKMLGVRQLSSEEAWFCRDVAMAMPDLDFIGLDIAVTPAGLRLIEVNRSPQFKRYVELGGSDLTAGFWQKATHRTMA